MSPRISNRQLGEIEMRITDIERRILKTLLFFKLLKTDQLRRMFFADGHSSIQASKTHTTKILRRLKAYGVIDHLAQQYRLGCYGPQQLIWHLTEAGYRLLTLDTEPEDKRRRFVEPTTSSVRHTIAVAECHLQFTEICKAEKQLSINRMEMEPDCWRVYQKDGKTISLRPDLYAETLCGEYRDRWFIEMDLDTESTQVVIEKCRRYHQYYLTNKEQLATGKFPVVMWIVPSERRKQNIVSAIKQTFGDRYVHMFIVITPERLHDILLNGVRKEDLC